MSLNTIYLARFMTASKTQKVDELLEVGREGRLLALESFWTHASVTQILEDYPEVKIFLDSGAFTLENEKVKDIQKYLDDYIDYILKYNDRLLAYANLDDVHDVEIGWKNQMYMESRGVRPVPVYHYGEEFKWAEKYINEYDYIGVGGVARGIPVGSLRALLDRVFDYREKKGLKTKVHGFGITGYQFMMRYPWYSVDSTTWLKQAGFGRILLPRFNAIKQDWDYMSTPFVISVSDISKVKEDTEHSHYSLIFPPKVVERIEEYFIMIGIDSKKLQTMQGERLKANAFYYEHLQKEEAIHVPPKIKDGGMLF